MGEPGLERKVMAGALAHAIRLGKCPRAGMVMGCNLSLDELDTETGALKQGEKHPYEFEVTDELLQEARALINAQAAIYREPKTTVVQVDGAPIPDVLWEAFRKKPGL